jgi:hypothetical protein
MERIDAPNRPAYISSVTKTIAYCVLSLAVAVVLVLAAAAPKVLGDSNLFLKGFVSDGLLDVLGVILAITLASAGQLHLTLNQIEERHDRVIFLKMRAGIKSAASMLIALFVAAVLLVVCKPLVSSNNDAVATLFNGGALFLLLWNVLLLISLTQGIFGIKSEVTPK